MKAIEVQMEDSEERYRRAVLESRPPRPKTARPIVVLGAGGIVRAAHLPAYVKAGFPVIAIADIASGKAAALASEKGIVKSFDSIEEAVRFAPNDAIYDVAVPASQIMPILPHLPAGAAVLMQKPMGDNLAEANGILSICRNKGLTAAVNFQLRWAPNMLVARSLTSSGQLGELHDMETGRLPMSPLSGFIPGIAIAFCQMPFVSVSTNDCTSSDPSAYEPVALQSPSAVQERPERLAPSD